MNAFGTPHCQQSPTKRKTNKRFRMHLEFPIDEASLKIKLYVNNIIRIFQTVTKRSSYGLAAPKISPCPPPPENWKSSVQRLFLHLSSLSSLVFTWLLYNLFIFVFIHPAVVYLLCSNKVLNKSLSLSLSVAAMNGETAASF